MTLPLANTNITGSGHTGQALVCTRYIALPYQYIAHWCLRPLHRSCSTGTRHLGMLHFVIWGCCTSSSALRHLGVQLLVNMLSR